MSRDECPRGGAHKWKNNGTKLIKGKLYMFMKCSKCGEDRMEVM